MPSLLPLLENVLKPLLLVSFALGSQWALSYALPVTLMTPLTDDDWPAFGDRNSTQSVAVESWITGLVLLICNVVFFSLWFLPLCFALWSTWVTARRWVPPAIGSRDIVHVDKDTLRRRFCERCEAPKDDRTYHCKPLDKCLPVYDHYCAWWHGAVWAHNVKAYIIFVSFLPVHQVFTFVVAVWALSSKYQQRVLWSQIAGVAVSVFGLVQSLTSLYYSYQSFISFNILETETKKKKAHLWVASVDAIIPFKMRYKTTNPWNLGYRENLRLFLGPWYKLPLFWVPSHIFYLENGYPVRADLLKGYDKPVELQPLRIDRRRNAATTGRLDAREDTLARRRHSF